MKVDVPSEVFKGLDTLKYEDWVEFNLTTAGGDEQNKTGGIDWEMDWQLTGGTDCISMTWISFTWGFWWNDVEILTWYDLDGTEVSVTGGSAWYCNDRILGLSSHWITSTILNTVYDPTTDLASFIVETDVGSAEFDIHFGFSGPYNTPAQAWANGDLQCLIGITFNNSKTYNGGAQMIFALLTFQPIEGVPDYMAYIFGTFLWVLIAVILMGLISRFIPFI